VIALTVVSTWKPNSSGTSAAVRWIQNVRNPADAAATPSQLLAETKPSGIVTLLGLSAVIPGGKRPL
jgi:hypothetical protein